MSTRRQSRERELLFLHLRRDGLTFGEIAARMRVSRQRAHHVVRRAERRQGVSESSRSTAAARGVVPRRKKKAKRSAGEGKGK